MKAVHNGRQHFIAQVYQAVCSNLSLHVPVEVFIRRVIALSAVTAAAEQLQVVGRARSPLAIGMMWSSADEPLPDMSRWQILHFQPWASPTAFLCF